MLNYAIFYDKNPEEALERFATYYQKFAAAQDPSFGVAYVYVNPDTGVITISNILADRKIKIEAKDTSGNYVPIKGDLIFSKTSKTQGSICLEGFGNIGCFKAETTMASWGAGMSKTEIGIRIISRLLRP